VLVVTLLFTLEHVEAAETFHPSGSRCPRRSSSSQQMNTMLVCSPAAGMCPRREGCQFWVDLMRDRLANKGSASLASPAENFELMASDSRKLAITRAVSIRCEDPQGWLCIWL
jgi:hypothetical protein